MHSLMIINKKILFEINRKKYLEEIEKMVLSLNVIGLCIFFVSFVKISFTHQLKK